MFLITYITKTIFVVLYFSVKLAHNNAKHAIYTEYDCKPVVGTIGMHGWVCMSYLLCIYKLIKRILDPLAFFF